LLRDKTVTSKDEINIPLALSPAVGGEGRVRGDFECLTLKAWKIAFRGA
jgi:hypothetical protein